MNLAHNCLGSTTKPAQQNDSSTPASSTQRSPMGRNPRQRGKVTVQATRLEAVDDSTGPLGPLGDNINNSEPEQPPAPPSKEQHLPVRNTRQTRPHSPRSTLDGSDLADDDRASTNSRQKTLQPGVLSPGLDGSRRQTQPSVSIEQAARPSFDITVGDPHKVGDITSSHIVYQVRTKVRQ